MTKSHNCLYKFGPFRLDLSKRLLLREGEPMPLRPKAFDTLLALVQNSGRVIDKDELIQMVWGEMIVEEGGLTRNISVLRKVLGESPDEHRYIVTAPGRGYRFVADVLVANQEEIKEAPGPVIESLAGLQAASIEIESTTPPTKAGRKSFPALSLKARLGLAASMATLAAASLIFYFYFYSGTANTGRETILLADFANSTGEAVFDGTLKQGLAIQLGQSPFMDIFPDEQVRATLSLMARAPTEKTNVEIGREICQRHGIKALVYGSIHSLGSHYVLTLEAIAAQTGEVIARQQAEIEKKEDVLKALGKAATSLRKQLGESLGTIRRFNAPVEQATTSSIEALKAYSLGLEQANKGKYSAAIPFYQHAIELDPDFALAYQALAREQLNTNYSDLVVEASEKAYELRERTTESEKFRIVSFYHLSVTRDLGKAIETGELWKQTYPNYWRPYHALADLYHTVGRYDKSIEAAREAVRLNPNVAAAYSNLAGSLISLNRFEEAKEVYRQAMSRNLDAPEYHNNLFWMAWFAGDAKTMREQVDWYAGSSHPYGGLFLQSYAAAMAGKWRKARDLSNRVLDIVQQRGMKGEVAWIAQTYALTSAALGDCTTSRRMAELTAASSTREMDLSSAAVAFAMCGETDRAQSIVDRLARRFPKDPTLNGVWLPTIRAAIELNREPANHRADRAIDYLKAISPNEAIARFWPAYLRGLAFLRKGMAADAAAAFQDIIENQGGTFWTPLYPLAHLGLARAARLTGEVGKDCSAYQDFLTLWKDADPDLPFLQESKREFEVR